MGARTTLDDPSHLTHEEPLPMSNAHHGSTPAAWTGVSIVFLAFVVGGLGLVLENMPVFWVGVALAPVGAIVGYVMSKMGLGGDPVER